MSKSRDPFPTYESAGYKPKYGTERVSECVQPKLEEPSTPEHIKKYRKSYKHAPGQTITHYGKVGDPLPPQQFAYGIKTNGSEHVSDMLKDDKLKGVQGYMREIKESKYPTSIKEPLGRVMSRGHNLPQETQDPNFRFGVPTVGSESAKDILYTPVGLEDGEDVKKQYVKSHQLWDAGEQKKRDYNWPFDPSNHMFGKTEKLVADEGKYILQPEVADNTFPKTKIVSKNVEDFRDFSGEQLGKTKNLGQTNQYVNQDHVFGYRPKEKEPWDAAKCIRGEGTQKTVKEDDNLGRSTRHGFRNTTKSGDENRVFGLPTIRNDIQKPAFKSVANTHNYGDEPAAIGVLFPQRFTEMGVNKEDFECLRSKEEIRKLFSNIGYNYKPGKFEGIFLRAQEICGTEQEKCSVKAFMEAVKEMDHL